MQLHTISNQPPLLLDTTLSNGVHVDLFSLGAAEEPSADYEGAPFATRRCV